MRFFHFAGHTTSSAGAGITDLGARVIFAVAIATNAPSSARTIVGYASAVSAQKEFSNVLPIAPRVSMPLGVELVGQQTASLPAITHIDAYAKDFMELQT